MGKKSRREEESRANERGGMSREVWKKGERDGEQVKEEEWGGKL